MQVMPDSFAHRVDIHRRLGQFGQVLVTAVCVLHCNEKGLLVVVWLQSLGICQ